MIRRTGPIDADRLREAVKEYTAYNRGRTPARLLLHQEDLWEFILYGAHLELAQQWGQKGAANVRPHGLHVDFTQPRGSWAVAGPRNEAAP